MSTLEKRQKCQASGGRAGRVGEVGGWLCEITGKESQVFDSTSIGARSNILGPRRRSTVWSNASSFVFGVVLCASVATASRVANAHARLCCWASLVRLLAMVVGQGMVAATAMERNCPSPGTRLLRCTTFIAVLSLCATSHSLAIPLLFFLPVAAADKDQLTVNCPSLLLLAPAAIHFFHLFFHRWHAAQVIPIIWATV